MASHLKSTAITNLDATPAVQSTTGEGAAGFMKTIDGYVVVPASDTTASTYQLVRVPTNAKVKSVRFESEAQGAGKVDLGVYYSTSTIDGTAAANQGLVVPGVGINLFATDIDCASAVAPTQEINQSGNYTLDLRDSPLWKAAGLTTDPGGMFDVVATVHTTAMTTGTGRLGVQVDYVL